MTIIDPVELFFAGDDGETITVIVKSVNTAHGVTANLDGKPTPMTNTGPQGSTLTFTLKMAAHDPSHLALLFHFLNTTGGGLYKVFIKGTSGPLFGMLVEQLNQKATAKIYTFDVV